MKRLGFTLVELLAVIVILAIILAIAIPSISTLIKNATRGAFEDDAKMVLTAIGYKVIADGTFDPSTVNETNINSLLSLSNANYQSVTVKKMNNTMYITIVGKNKWANLTASGTKNIIKVDDTVTTLSYGANKPVLATNMVPIKWVDGACVEGVCAEGTWEDTTVTDPAWYNYDPANKRWANAKTVDGSMWVWIPRYIYEISSGWHLAEATGGTIDVQFSKGVDDNWNKAVIGNIDLGETAKASDNKWTNHPAFTFGDTELTGFWMAKFEPTAAGGVSNSAAGDNVTSKIVKIIPNVQSWRYIDIGNMFTVSRNMETNAIYGWGNSGKGIDTHMMKNTELGAIAYLSKSIYGKDAEEIWINNANNYTTGCAGNSATAGASTTGCINVYNSDNGKQASTTGNIYGVYDMSGGAWERVSAYVNNDNANLDNSASNVISADAKYKNVYTVGKTDDQSTNYGLTFSLKGDAVYETSNDINGPYSWFSDYSYMPNTTHPWFLRAGGFLVGSDAGAFFFSVSYLNPAVDPTNSAYTFRPVLVVGSGL